MSEYRQDPLSQRWVIIGCDERSARPNEFVEATSRRDDVACPFCAGHETDTPAALASYSVNGKGTWLVRVVPNKYPVVKSSAPVVVGPTPKSDAGQAAVPGFGHHEVIIESPRHVASLSDLTDAEAELAFTAYRDRIRVLKADGRYRYVQIFKNAGPAAGASLEHVHSQLLALPQVPEVVQQELANSANYFQQHRRPLLVDLIEQEIGHRCRIVAITEQFIAYCPPASRFPYEVWLAPRRHQSRFEDLPADKLGELSRLARDCISCIERALAQPAYNYFLHTQPFDSPAHDHYHWHIEIIPRLTKIGGFEWGTGCFINPQVPESAAAELRAALPSTRAGA